MFIYSHFRPYSFNSHPDSPHSDLDSRRSHPDSTRSHPASTRSHPDSPHSHHFPHSVSRLPILAFTGSLNNRNTTSTSTFVGSCYAELAGIFILDGTEARSNWGTT